MKLVITIDVEEEGLFGGTYPRSGATVSNVALLEKLEWLTMNFDLPLTLLVDHAVASSGICAAVLQHWQNDLGAEIGAHLHPWNTPPFGDGDPLVSTAMPPELLSAKLGNVLVAVEACVGERPRSFRMGRWDFSENVRRAVLASGLQVDASVAPLKHTPAGTTWFNAPAEPFWLDAEHSVLEVPLTVLPIVPALGRLAANMGKSVTRRFSSFGALGIQPVWFPAWSMRQAVRLHVHRHGEVLNLFFHSSELLPGASPHFPTEQSVRDFLEKLRTFVVWLKQYVAVEGRTLSGLRQDLEAK